MWQLQPELESKVLLIRCFSLLALDCLGQCFQAALVSPTFWAVTGSSSCQIKRICRAVRRAFCCWPTDATICSSKNFNPLRPYEPLQSLSVPCCSHYSETFKEGKPGEKHHVLDVEASAIESACECVCVRRKVACNQVACACWKVR